MEGTYDRHSYADEKRDALEKLAVMIERILNPAGSNVATIDETPRAGVDVSVDKLGQGNLEG